MASETLKEFLVALSYKIDGSSERKFTESVEKATKLVIGLGVALEAAALTLVASVAKISQGLEGLYYSSQRTQASAANIKAFTFAASQMGSSVEAAGSSLEGFAQKLRTSPGHFALLESLGVKARDANGHMRDTTEVLSDLGRQLSSKPYYTAKQYADQFGIDERTLMALERYGEFAERMRANRGKMTALGFDPDQAAAGAQKLQNALRNLWDTIQNIAQGAAANFFRDFQADIDGLNKYLVDHGKDISATLEAIAKAILEIAKGLTAWMADPAVKDAIPHLAQQFRDAHIDETIKEWLAPLKEFVSWIKFVDGLFDGALGLANKGHDAIFGKDGGMLGTGKSEEQYMRERTERRHRALDRQKEQNKADEQDDRSLWERWAPKILGGKDAPVGGKLSDAPGIRLGGRKWSDATKAGASGTYRPTYSLSNADLSDRVINTIAGEARVNDPNSVDAVINNMLNRVGSKGWGPSGNLEQVARAPGQYAGYRRANEKEAAFIRERIRTIASGGVPDNTNGSNAYRAGWYRGPWFRKHQDAPVVGGNRFAYEPGVPNGPYAPYEHPREPRSRVADVLNQISGAVGAGSAKAAEAIRSTPITAPALVAPSLGNPLSNSWQQSTVNVQAPQNINIYGTNDPNDAALAFGRMGKRVNADLVRNVQNAAQ